ncbi:protein SFI1 homolog [Ceratina calcarata]|uniref:Protein SFI1 homolog n=1 Tax=Ceratina calcarata TaxID=156304 RepID=A0AAJ7RWL8_9HYME|nr:protein SFI1 homolog [Ceratina calcarata]
MRSRLNFNNRAILKNVFEHWKMYVIHKLHRRRVTYKANYFYQMKLQRKVLNALSKNVLLKWEQIVSSMDKCNDISEASPECKIDRIHYSQYLLRKSFKYWCNYIGIMNKKKALLEKAVQFHNSYCLKKCIINWKIFLTLQKKKRYRIEQARKWYEKKILEKCIRVWINVSELESQRSKMGRAIQHYDDKLLIKYFRAWRMYHEYKVKKLKIEVRVLAYSRRKLLKRYFELFVAVVVFPDSRIHIL